jgi:hypothetical protein
VNIFGEQLPASASDAQTVKIGDNTFFVNATNYKQVADKYYEDQKRRFGATITESDRLAYYDTFAQIAKQDSQNYTLDENGAVVPNNQGVGNYLWNTVKGGIEGSAKAINRDLLPQLPSLAETRILVYAAVIIVLMSVYLRSKGK